MNSFSFKNLLSLLTLALFISNLYAGDQQHILTRAEIMQKIDGEKRDAISSTQTACSAKKFFIWKNSTASAKFRAFALNHFATISDSLKASYIHDYEERYFQKSELSDSQIYGPGRYLSDSIYGASLQRQRELAEKEKMEIDSELNKEAAKIVAELEKAHPEFFVEMDRSKSATLKLYDLRAQNKEIGFTNIAQTLELAAKDKVAKIKSKFSNELASQKLYQISFSDPVTCIDLDDANFQAIKNNMRKQLLLSSIAKKDIGTTKNLSTLFHYKLQLPEDSDAINFYIFRDNIPHSFSEVTTSDLEPNELKQLEEKRVEGKIASGFFKNLTKQLDSTFCSCCY